METRVHPSDLPRASRVTSELLPSRAVVTGLTKPLVSQVKDAAYFRPKSQGQDGAQWNDPEIHAPETRQVLFVRPDLDDIANQTAAAKQANADHLANKSRMEKLLLRRELSRQQYADKKAERLVLEARAGQRKTPEVIEFVEKVEQEKKVLIKTLRVKEKSQEVTRASSRPQSAASHSSVTSALRAYEYATLNMPAPTNQVSDSAAFNRSLQAEMRPLDAARRVAATQDSNSTLQVALSMRKSPSAQTLPQDEKFDHDALEAMFGEPVESTGDASARYVHARVMSNRPGSSSRPSSAAMISHSRPLSGMSHVSATSVRSVPGVSAEAVDGLVGVEGDGCQQHHLFLPAQAVVPTLANVSLELAMKGVQRKNREYFHTENGWNKLFLVPDRRLQLIQLPDKDQAAIEMIDKKIQAEEAEDVRRFQRRRDIHDQIASEFRQQTILNRNKEMRVGVRHSEHLHPVPAGAPPPVPDMAFATLRNPPVTVPAYQQGASESVTASFNPHSRSTHFSALTASACGSLPASSNTSQLPLSASITRQPIEAVMTAARLLQRSTALSTGASLSHLQHSTTRSVSQPEEVARELAAAQHAAPYSSTLPNLMPTAAFATTLSQAGSRPGSSAASLYSSSPTKQLMRPQTAPDGTLVQTLADYPNLLSSNANVNDNQSETSMDSSKSRLLKPRTATELPIHVTHDHRDYMGLTDSLRHTHLAPTHVHTYVHSGVGTHTHTGSPSSPSVAFKRFFLSDRAEKAEQIKHRQERAVVDSEAKQTLAEIARFEKQTKSRG